MGNTKETGVMVMLQKRGSGHQTPWIAHGPRKLILNEFPDRADDRDWNRPRAGGGEKKALGRGKRMRGSVALMRDEGNGV